MFNKMLLIAVEMGYDLQSKKFWRTTPANLLRQYQGFKIKQQTDMLPIRRLMHLFAASKGLNIDERKLFSLSFLDEPIVKEKGFRYTEEEVEKLEANHLKVKAKFLERRAERQKNKNQKNKIWQQKF